MGLLDLVDSPGSVQLESDESKVTWANQDSQGYGGSTRLDGNSQAPIYQLNDSNLKSLAQRADADGNSAFPYGDLTHTLDKLLMERHQPLTALKFFPTSREMGWSKHLELFTMNDQAEPAKIVCCSNDFPRVAISGCTWKTGRVVIGTGYRICYDLLQSQKISKAQINYEANLMRVAIRSLREKANKLAYHGSVANNVLGILNNPYIPTLISPAEIDASINPRLALAILTEAACQQYVNTGGAAYLPNAILLPPSRMRRLMKMLMSNTGDSPASVMQQFSLFAPNIEFFGEAPELENAGPNGEAVAFLYRRDRECMEWHYPIPLEVLPYYWNGYEWEINLVSVVSSIWPYYPEDCLKIIGI